MSQLTIQREPRRIIASVKPGIIVLPQRTGGFGRATDLDAADAPGIDRGDVSDDEGDAWVAADVAPLPTVGDAEAADVDRVLVRIIAEVEWSAVRLADRGAASPPRSKF
jgi:hypothetical protein